LSNSFETPDATTGPDGVGEIDVGGHVGSLHLLKDGAPRYELRIDREGRWFHEGVEIVREDIRNYFSRHLVRDENGGYVVRIGDDECAVTVDDAPFVVVRVEGSPSDRLSLLLNDGGRVLLEPRTIEFRQSNIPYCRVRGGLDARFSRPAYYQLTKFIEHDEEADIFRLVFDGQVVDLDIS
jgi:hypothetical protein